MVLITGASSGIGKACAEKFAEAGHSVYLWARREERLSSLASDLSHRFKVQVAFDAVDVRDSAAVTQLVQSRETLVREISILVSNAGLARGLDPIQTGKLSDWEEMIDTNLKGLLYVTHAILPYFLEKKAGHIIQMGSIASRWAYVNGNVYSATKRAVSALTESMRLDLAGTGIRVTEIAPGMVETEFSSVRFRDEEKAKSVYRGLTPLSAGDIAEAVVWAASRPSHVNIQELVIYPTAQASPQSIVRSP
jgi:3-hydroxy acid dehydrogenase / malonic semialdehyde reductase